MKTKRRWVNEHRCVACKEVLSEFERLHSDGRCPKCNHKDKNSITIVATTEHGKETTVRWWEFWK